MKEKPDGSKVGRERKKVKKTSDAKKWETSHEDRENITHISNSERPGISNSRKTELQLGYMNTDFVGSRW